MQELTGIQKKVLEFVAEGLGGEGVPPTLEEIRDRFGWKAVGTVQDHVRALLKKGYLIRGKGARGLRVVRDPEWSLPEEGLWSPPWEEKSRASRRTVLVPVIGEVAAGSPILAVENVREGWLIDRKVIEGEDVFFLQVRGDSMTGAQIKDGDYVMVKPQPTAASGEIVVARIGDEVTVKRFQQGKRRVELLPENPAYRPVVCRRGEELEIVGKVIGVLRKY